MRATMSKTYLKEVGGKEVFCKLKPCNDFDTRTVMFQAKIAETIGGIFSINKFKGINLIQADKSSYYEIQFEKLSQMPWEPTEANMKLIGTSMAHIHNYAHFNKDLINLSVKSETYSDMNKWITLKKEFETAYTVRNDIFEQIKRFNLKQPRIPLHRDFKLHNIVYDGTKYSLIDFDFAAADFVSIEIMGFIVDVIPYGMEFVKTFFEAYHKTIDIPVDQSSYVTDYLNYLCTNTFPYYLKDKLSVENMTELVEYRNKCLNTIYSNKDELNKIIEETQYVSN